MNIPLLSFRPSRSSHLRKSERNFMLASGYANDRLWKVGLECAWWSDGGAKCGNRRAFHNNMAAPHSSVCFSPMLSCILTVCESSSASARLFVHLRRPHRSDEIVLAALHISGFSKSSSRGESHDMTALPTVVLCSRQFLVSQGRLRRHIQR